VFIVGWAEKPPSTVVLPKKKRPAKGAPRSRKAST
jgi:hypothetical protein